MTDPTCPVEMLQADMAVDLRWVREAISGGLPLGVTLARLDAANETLHAGLAHITALLYDDRSERF